MSVQKLIIDSRESSNLYEYVESEAHRLVIMTEKQWLEVGDYAFDDVCFEAKSTIDFLQSVINKRLWNQVDNMDRHYEHTFVIIHGSLHEAMNYPKYINMKIPQHVLKNKFYGAIGKLSLDTDTKVFWVESPKKAAKIITTTYFYYVNSQKKENIKKDILPSDLSWNFIFIAALSGIIGAKLFAVFEDFDEIKINKHRK